ncbi:MAG: hypothetical protein G01um101477_464, partial [Candidatus Doudnabacteria bacterium Gr01-1014_77]
MNNIVHRHGGVGIVSTYDRKKFLFGMYDSTYPKIKYRGSVNVLGGNFKFGDSSPFEIFKREINEEFS